MKRILSIFTAVVLLSLSLTLGSCEKCNKEKPADGDANASNTPSDTNPTPSDNNPTPEEKEKELEAKVRLELAKAAHVAVEAWVERTKTRNAHSPEAKDAAARAADRAKEAEAAAEATKDARTSPNLKIADDAKATELLAKFATWCAKCVAGWALDLKIEKMSTHAAATRAEHDAGQAYIDINNKSPNALAIAKNEFRKAGGDHNGEFFLARKHNPSPSPMV